MKRAVCFGLILIHALSLVVAQAQTRPQTIAGFNPSLTNAHMRLNPRGMEGHWHSVVRHPSSKLPEIHWYNKLNPVWWFKNADEPRAPDWFQPGAKRRQFKWFLRNPFHNFTYYVIGIADKEFIRSGRYPEQISNPHGGWNCAIAVRRILFLPYLSYRRGKFEFYFGWRVRGNFGIKINFNAARTHPLPKPEAPAPASTEVTEPTAPSP